jgi:hypothetical protein
MSTSAAAGISGDLICHLHYNFLRSASVFWKEEFGLRACLTLMGIRFLPRRDQETFFTIHP